MLILPMSRDQLLNFMPRAGTVAEIGVAKADFSRNILAHAAPARLHLIDPWIHQQRSDYAHDISNVKDSEQEDRHLFVRNGLRAEIESGQVILHREYSKDACIKFSDNYFDWIYIDGLHSYQGVKEDLDNYLPKVKPDGFILGHDFANHPEATAMEFGVVKAVEEFVRTKGLAFVAMTMETWPTYVISRSMDNPKTALLIQKLQYNLPNLIEIRDYPATGSFRYNVSRYDTGKATAVFSF